MESVLFFDSGSSASLMFCQCVVIIGTGSLGACTTLILAERPTVVLRDQCSDRPLAAVDGICTMDTFLWERR